MDASLRSASRRDFWIGSGQHEFHLSGRKRLPASAAFLCVSIHLHFESHTSTGHVTFQITQLLKDRFRLLQLNFSTLQSQTSNSSSSASTFRNLTSPAEIQTTASNGNHYNWSQLRVSCLFSSGEHCKANIWCFKLCRPRRNLHLLPQHGSQLQHYQIPQSCRNQVSCRIRAIISYRPWSEQVQLRPARPCQLPREPGSCRQRSANCRCQIPLGCSCLRRWLDIVEIFVYGRILRRWWWKRTL